jgi:hypothetical protein
LLFSIGTIPSCILTILSISRKPMILLLSFIVFAAYFNIYDFMFYTSVIPQSVYTTYILHWNGWNHLDRLPHTCVMSHDPRHTTAAEKTIIWCSDSLCSWWGCPKGMWLQNRGFGNNLAKLGHNLIIILQ